MQQKSKFIIFLFILMNQLSPIYAKSHIMRAAHTNISNIENSNTLMQNWHLKKPDTRSPVGINAVSQTYLNKEIIVAVIDTGVDINNKSLEKQIWINKNEIPNNNIDDDENGYIDDISGWNFLGSVKGNIKYAIDHEQDIVKAKNGNFAKQVTNDSLEITRKLKRLISDKNDGAEFSKLFLKINQMKKRAIKLKKAFLEEMIIFEKASQVLKITSPLEEITIDLITKIKPKDDYQKIAFNHLKKLLFNNKGYKYLVDQFNEYYIQENFHYNIDLNQREEIVQDDINDFNQSFYGNNNIIGFNPDHGTKVASLISASPHRKSLVKGVANNLVKIMPIRAIPNGDERDKDIVNAIRYAVDNGADIINMSFGKYISPDNEKVSAALEYAKTKNVIVVMAAGNDYTNISKKRSFPSPFVKDEKLENCLIVAASSPYTGKNIIAPFTNYGDIIDILAPGEKIYTISSGNRLVQESGTSLAAPLVSATAGLIKKINPNLSSYEIVNIIKENGTDLAGTEAYIPELGTVPIETIFSNPKILNIGKIFSSNQL